MSQLAGAQADAVLRAEDYQRAKDFYHNVLGFEVRDMPGEPKSGMVVLPQGTEFMIYERPDVPAPGNTTLALGVENVEDAVAELRDKGVKFEDYDIPQMNLKTTDGIAHIGGSDFAWFKDTEGNILSLGEQGAIPH